jgi:hypothetical protein
MVRKNSNITKSRMPKYRKEHTSHDSGSFYFRIPGVSISGFLHGKQKIQHHEVPNVKMRNHDLISILEFQIPRVGGVKETHDKNDKVAK